MSAIALTEEERYEAGLVTLTCDPCRGGAGMAPLHPELIGDRTWYYCPCCSEQWTVLGTNAGFDPLIVTVNVMLLLLLAAGLIGIVYLVTADAAARYGTDYLHDGRYGGHLLVGVGCWLLLLPIAVKVYTQVMKALARTARFVWGY